MPTFKSRRSGVDLRDVVEKTMANLSPVQHAGLRLDSRFKFGDRVIVDDDHSLVAVVTAILWKTTSCSVEVAWVHSGDLKSAYIDEWRLNPAESQ
jgi:hypothetical protein